MKIQIVGVGVVGTAQAYLASRFGHEVVGFDRSKTKSDYARMVKELERDVDLTFVCVPEAAAGTMVGELADKGVKGLYVIKSTVPPSTTQTLMDRHGIHICHNPEFLKEKDSLEDVMSPSCIVIGQCCEEHGNMLKEFYSPFKCAKVVSNPTCTELVKLTINSYLATLIAFWNEIDKVAGVLHVETRDVADIAKLNPRVSAYGTDFFGVPFGGKCLPKDLEQVIQLCHQSGVDSLMLEAVRDFNKRM
jgi:GDP-mannose 6-dehydrogenase